MSPQRKVLCIIQARMASSRLPGKVLLNIAGKPMLHWVVERAWMAEKVDEVVVATTTDPSDDPIANFCEKQGYAFTRGHPFDVLDRFVQTARKFEPDIVVRVTADCPLIDPGLIDETIGLLLGTQNPESETHALDFVANRLPPPWGRTYPIGLDVEVVRTDSLERAWSEAEDTHYREHVMPFFYDDLPEAALKNGRVTTTPRHFRVAQLHHGSNFGAVRWTVDTPEDLAAVRALAKRLPENFTWLDALKIWQAHPEIAAINANVEHKTAADIDDRA